MKSLLLYLQSRRFFFFLLCFQILFPSKGQVISNLVSNYSFEDTTKCPKILNVDDIKCASFWFKPRLYGSTDYFNSCSPNFSLSTPSNMVGSQSPKTGVAYGGLITYVFSLNDYREYAENRLKSTMKSNKSYCITFYASLAESSQYATGNIGVVFSKDSIIDLSLTTTTTLINQIPNYESTVIISDTLNWQKIQGFYLSAGIENFITIGNFRNDPGTGITQIKPLTSGGAYYYIDDVSVVEINPSNADLKDTIFICPTNTLVLGTDSTWDATYSWQEIGAGSSLSCSNCPNPIASPTITTKYFLTKQQCSATTVDSVLVIVITPTTQANAGNTTIICLGSQTQLGSNDSLKFTSYSWSPNFSLSCTNCAMPFANPNVTTTYTVQRTECSVLTKDTITVFVDDCNPSFTIPNVFTPNFDDVNDTWGIMFSSAKYIKDFKLKIYDRWGLQVYSTNSELSTPNSMWDGRTSAGVECTNGVYFYITTFIKNEEHVNLKGVIHLIR